MPDTQMDDEKARETFGIKSGDWIVTVSDEELVVLKAALRTHAEKMVRVAAETMKQRRRDTVEGRAPHATYEELARAALEAALSGHVVVPHGVLSRVVEIAHRNECDPDTERLRAMIQAAPPVPEMEG